MIMASHGVAADYRSRLVQREVHGMKLKGLVVQSRALTDVAAGGGGQDDASGAVLLWRVRWDDTGEEEELLEADLLPLLVPGRRGGGKGSGGKAAQPAASARLVARKVAERPPPFEYDSNAGPRVTLPAAPQQKRPAGATAKGAQPAKRKRPMPPPPPAPAEADEADPLSKCHLEMKGAAVEDHELPQLLTGEVRVLGQTLTRTAALARSRAVAEWRRQGRDKQQWAEILSPIADADKAAVLCSLHRFLGLTAGQELISALPPDPPCSSLVEKFEIPDNDPRVALRGQFGVRVKAGGPPLPPLVVVGTYRAFTPTHDEYNHSPAYKYGSDERVRSKLSHTLERRGADAGPPLGAEIDVEIDTSELLFDSFTADYELWNQRHGVGDNPLPQPPGGDGNAVLASPAAPMPQLMASAYGFGNMMCLINDGLGPRPKGLPSLSDDESERVCNAKLIEVLVHGWPAILVVTVKQVQPGQELLLLYGDGYWEQLRQLAARLQGHRANLAAEQQRLRVGGGAPAPSAASGGEVGGSAAAPVAGGKSGGSDQPAAPLSFVPQPSILAGPGRGAPAAAAAAAAHQVRFADALPSYDGAAFDCSAAKRHAAAEGAAAFEPAACAAGFEALVECRDGMPAAEAADAARAARALSEGLAAAAAEGPSMGERTLSIADALHRARAAAEERGRELARDVAADK